MREERGRGVGWARAGVSAIFALNGAGAGNWVARIPAIRDDLHLDTQTLGLALLGLAVGSLLGLPLSGALLARFGSRRMATVAGFAYCACLVLPPLAVNAATLGLALVALGAAAGILDVSMNAAGAAVEQRWHTSIMSSFHAAFSFGGLLGAALGGFAAGRGLSPLAHLALAAIVGFGLMVLATRPLLPPDASERHAGPVFALPTRGLALLGLIGFAALLGEGAIADWSGIFLRDARAADPATAAYGFAAFSLCMAIGRLAGDWLVGRIGTVNTVRGGGLVAAAGLATALLGPSVGLALVGFAGVGLGLSIVFPLLVSAAARRNEVPCGAAIGAVSTLGYFGFLAGPPLLGFVAHGTSIGTALWIVVALCAGIAALAGATAPVPVREYAPASDGVHRSQREGGEARPS
jgi:MFS family permease